MVDSRHDEERYDVAIGWGKTEAPAELRDRMFDFNVAVLGGMAGHATPPAPARTPREELAIAMA